jgi:L-2-hydroxyglutarate oxidase LhgO
LADYEPLARTVDQFLWSPTTSIADKNEINNALFHDVMKLGAKVVFGAKFGFEGREFSLQGETIKYSYLINCAGSSSLKIANTMGFGGNYQMFPFLGAYRAVPTAKLPLRTLVYPIPDPVNPFLGTHFTITADGYTKIGPTALPVLFAEQYSFFEGWNIYDGRQTLDAMTKYLRNNLATSLEMGNRELKRIFLTGLINSASELVPSAADVSGWERKPAGIRAQLFDKSTKALEQDFIVEIPSSVYTGTITDILVEPRSTQYLLLDVPEINAGGGGNIFIMSE